MITLKSISDEQSIRKQQKKCQCEYDGDTKRENLIQKREKEGK